MHASDVEQHLSFKFSYHEGIQVDPKSGTFFFESIFLEYPSLNECISLHTFGIFHCKLQSIGTDKTGCSLQKPCQSYLKCLHLL